MPFAEGQPFAVGSVCGSDTLMYRAILIRAGQA
jgi:hypothetical protein